jgi:hypothetical protein
MSTGRPPLYSEELADRICDRIANTTLGLAAICREEGMPHRNTVTDWIEKNKEFSNKYARAKARQLELLAEEILEISDHTNNDTLTINKGDETIEIPNTEWINRSKLRVDSRKWLLSKLDPKKYGDKVDVTQTNIVVKVPNEDSE